MNVSAYAPFQHISQFLYHFLCFGIIWDATTGEMLSLSPNITWLVSIQKSSLLLYYYLMYIIYL